MDKLLERITINPDIAHGKPTIKNTRYTVSSMLEYLAGGDTIEELLAEFQDLTKEDILACFAYAAQAIDLKEVKISG